MNREQAIEQFYEPWLQSLGRVSMPADMPQTLYTVVLAYNVADEPSLQVPVGAIFCTS